MKFRRATILQVLVSALASATAFVQQSPQRMAVHVEPIRHSSTLFADNKNVPNVDRMKQLIQEEASDANMMKAAAEQMKNLTPEQIDMMIRDMEQMNPIQKQALKALGMDPNAMMQTMKMMKDNPQMIESAQKLMANMTPQQMMEQSRMAQERLKNMSPQQLEEINQAMSTIPKENLDQAVEILSKQQAKAVDVQNTNDLNDDNEDDDSVSSSIGGIATGPGTSSDPNVISVMYQVAEFMSNDGETIQNGIGGVTFAGFASLPVIQMLSGSREQDLSPVELKECWANGSLGATRVDRNGFERVWKEVQDYFEDDIMGEARKEAKRRVTTKKRGTDKSTTTTTISASSSSSAPQVGASLTEDQLAAANEQFKKMSDDDMAAMFEAMQNMDPATEARLRAMGTDPNMLRQTAKLMNSNPLMRKAAKEMIKNMSGTDMLKVSQQAQKEMQNMTPEQRQAVMNMSPEQQEALKNMSMEEMQRAMKGMNLEK